MKPLSEILEDKEVIRKAAEGANKAQRELMKKVNIIIAIRRFCEYWSIEKEKQLPLKDFIMENIIPNIREETIKECLPEESKGGYNMNTQYQIRIQSEHYQNGFNQARQEIINNLKEKYNL